MKDYSLKRHKKFIINYNIQDNFIIINYADKSKKISPYTYDKEKKILQTMKEQITDTNYEKKIRNKLDNEKTKNKVSSIFSILIGSSLMLTNISFSIGAIIYSTLLVNILTCIFSKFKTIKLKNIVKDINKNKLFIENERLLTTKLDNSDYSLNINDIHTYSYNKLNNTINYKKRVLRKNIFNR